MHILIAPDSFKGSLSAQQAAAAIAAGIRDTLGEQWPGRGGEATPLRLSLVPMADGGEGSVAAFAEAWQLPLQHCETVDALGRPRTAAYLYDPHTKHAVVELAEASGLPAVSDVAPQPLTANTFGTGIVLRHALQSGARRITLCVGGSATTDGGIGALAALGVVFRDAAGEALPPNPSQLLRIASVDASALIPAARDADWVLPVDVTNPLTGPAGAAAVFGPQKGATAEQVAELDRGLCALAAVLERKLPSLPAPRQGPDAAAEAQDAAAVLPGTDADVPGMGAAGGIPYLLMKLCGAKIVPGSEHIAELLGLPELLRSADVVVTGEGSCDAQSAAGKVVSQVAALAQAAPKQPPVCVLAGRVACDQAALRAMGVAVAVSIADGPATLDQLCTDAAGRLRAAAAQLAAAWMVGAGVSETGHAPDAGARN